MFTNFIKFVSAARCSRYQSRNGKNALLVFSSSHKHSKVSGFDPLWTFVHSSQVKLISFSPLTGLITVSVGSVSGRILGESQICLGTIWIYTGWHWSNQKGKFLWLHLTRQDKFCSGLSYLTQCVVFGLTCLIHLVVKVDPPTCLNQVNPLSRCFITCQSD